MLLRLLDLHGKPDRAERNTGATSLDSSVLRQQITEACSSPRPHHSRHAIHSNPIVTADSIISTLQMEMATAGLTAAAISAATRHLETAGNLRPTAERPGGASSTPSIAPRPSLGRLDMVDTISTLPDSLASLLVSDQTTAQLTSLLANSDTATTSQSRLASMFSPEPPQTRSLNTALDLGGHFSQQGGRLANLLGGDNNQTQLASLLGTDIGGTQQATSEARLASLLGQDLTNMVEREEVESPQRDCQGSKK